MSITTYFNGTQLEGYVNVEAYVLDCEYGYHGFNGKLDLRVWHQKGEVLSCPENFVEFSRVEDSHGLVGLCCSESSQVDL